MKTKQTEDLDGNGFQDFTPEQKQVRAATRKLIKAMERVPGLPEKLCGKAPGQEVDEGAVLDALRHAREGPHAALLDAGMATEDLDDLEQIMHLVFPPLTEKEWKFLKDKVKILSFLCMFLGVVTVGFGVFSHFSSEWIEGRCWITGYDGPCADCKVQIRVLDAITGERYLGRKYRPEMQRDWSTEEVKMVHEPFTCCGRSSPDNPFEIFNCCEGFFDKMDDLFCDQWGHLSKDNQPCPDGDWSCSYIPPRIDMERSVDVQGLRPYVDKGAFHAMMGGVCLFALGLIRLMERLGAFRQGYEYLKQAPAIVKEQIEKRKKSKDKDSEVATDIDSVVKKLDRSPTVVVADIDDEDANEKCIAADSPTRVHADALRPIITPLEIQKERRRKERAASSSWGHSTWSDARSMRYGTGGFSQHSSTWHPQRFPSEDLQRLSPDELVDPNFSWKNQASFNRHRLKTPGPKIQSSQLGYRSWTRWSRHGPMSPHGPPPPPVMSRSCESWRTASSERRSEESSGHVAVTVAAPKPSKRSRSDSALRKTADSMDLATGGLTFDGPSKRSASGSPPRRSSLSAARWSVASSQVSGDADDPMRRTFG